MSVQRTRIVKVTLWMDDEENVVKAKDEIVRPLTAEQIEKLAHLTSDRYPEDFVRAIEQAHGIR